MSVRESKPKTHPLIDLDSNGYAEGFRVVVEREIGQVSFDAGGEHTPEEAAFLLIARAGEPGVYKFPSRDEGTTVVTVEHDQQDLR